MIASSHAQLLTILASHPDGLKTAEIVSIADENPKSEIADNSAASKMIYSLRGSGLITSWTDAGKNKHKITPKGLDELQAFYNEETHSIQPSVKTTQASYVEVDSGERPNAKMEETIPARLGIGTPLVDAHPETNTVHTTAIQIQEKLQPLQTDEIPRLVTYDPFGEIYQELQKAQDLIDKLPRPQPLPKIHRVKEKQLMLQLIKNHYELINQDVGELFADMIEDYKKLGLAA